MTLKGKLITFEGSEGSGKSTQARLAYTYLRKRGKNVLLLREPGGTAISEAIRRILLDVKNAQMTRGCETLLYMAARSQLVEERIYPALTKGVIVLCDRFLDSTIVYQGFGFGVDRNFIKTVGRFVTQGIAADLTLVFDIPVKEGLSRTGQIKDRIELRPLRYHTKVREGYLTIARQEPRRVKVVKVEGGPQEIQKKVRG